MWFSPCLHPCFQIVWHLEPLLAKELGLPWLLPWYIASRPAIIPRSLSTSLQPCFGGWCVMLSHGWSQLLPVP